MAVSRLGRVDPYVVSGCTSASGGKKFGQQHTALVGAHTPQNCRMMVQTALSEQIDYRPACARFWIARTVNDPRDSCVKHRARAHCAWLERAIQRAIDEPIIATRSGRFA